LETRCSLLFLPNKGKTYTNNKEGGGEGEGGVKLAGRNAIHFVLRPLGASEAMAAMAARVLVRSVFSRFSIFYLASGGQR
jgi:hypothetical protein